LARHRSESPSQALHSAWRSALVSTLAGYAFSLILSAVIVILLALDFAPVRILERAGIDLGMRVYAAYQPNLDPNFQAPPYAYVFLDLDDGVCRDEPQGGLWTCPADEPAPPSLVRALVESASAGGAAVVIVDVAPPRQDADRAALIHVMADGAGPLVIAPLVADPKGDRSNLFRPDNPLLQQGFAQGRLRLAPLVTQADPNAGDGVIRHYPSFVGVGTRDLPTAPFLAAAWLSGPNDRAEIGCDRYRIGREHCAVAGPGGAQTGSGNRLAPVAAGSSAGDLSPLFWTLPQLRSVDDYTRGDFEATFQYIRVSEARTGTGGLDISPDAFRGRVVVIGSSSPRARDLHLTPLGVMSGPELVLNAVRSFLEFGPMRESRATRSFGDTLMAFWSKATGALLPAIMVFPAWWFIYWSRRRTARRRWLTRTAVGTLGVMLFASLLLAGIVVELLQGISAIKGNAALGTPVDIITPVAALGLEIFADLAKSLLARIEIFIISTLGAINVVGRQVVAYTGRFRGGAK
jgi:CHASE2 domain